MDEGRLGVVVRQEEQHRKFVHMMNDIVRSRLGVYSNFLDREQHEAAVKYSKNCVTMKRSIVRQSVLKKCLEARRQKTLARDPDGHFGQYGGKPLYTLSRDIDRVIADNHPKLRRLKRVELAMRQSLESGAILDHETVARRVDAFFSLRLNRKSSPRAALGPEAGETRDVFSRSSQQLRRRRETRLPSIVAQRGGGGGEKPSRTTPGISPRHGPQPPPAEGPNAGSATAKEVAGQSQPADRSSSLASSSSSPSDGRVGLPALSLDPKGRLRGIAVNAQNIHTIHEQEDDPAAAAAAGQEDRDSAASSGAAAGREARRDGGRGEAGRAAIGGGGGGLAGSKEGGRGKGKERRGRRQGGSDVTPPPPLKPRPKLVLPPIQSSKALVSRT